MKATVLASHIVREIHVEVTFICADETGCHTDRTKPLHSLSSCLLLLIMKV